MPAMIARGRRAVGAAVPTPAGRGARVVARRRRSPDLLMKSRAEREGFEPSDEVDPRHTISSRARSAAPAPLLEGWKGSPGDRASTVAWEQLDLRARSGAIAAGPRGIDDRVGLDSAGARPCTHQSR